MLQIGQSWINNDCTAKLWCESQGHIRSQVMMCDETRGQCRVDMIAARRDCFCIDDPDNTCEGMDAYI